MGSKDYLMEEKISLKDVALAWNSLMSKEYVFKIKYRADNIKSIRLQFRDFDFFHAAGFQYMKDIRIPRFSKSKYLQKSISNEISEDLIARSQFYIDTIYPRWVGILNLEQLLDSAFKIYKFTPEKLTFHTSIEAKFLLSNKELDISVFLFLDEDSYDEDSIENPVFCRSVFEQNPSRDYTINQKGLNIVYKEKICEESTVLLNRI